MLSEEKPITTLQPERESMRVKNTASTHKNSNTGSSSNGNTVAVVKPKAKKDDHANDHKNKKHSNLRHEKLSLNSSKSLFPTINTASSSGHLPLHNATNTNDSLLLPPKGYLVWSEFCKMPNLDPYLPEVMKHFRREKYKPCKLLPPLTRVDFNRSSQRYILRIDDDVLPGYSTSGKVDCCYQSIIRDGTGSKADSQIR